MTLRREPLTGRVAALAVEQDDGMILVASGLLTFFVAENFQLGAKVEGQLRATFIPTKAEKKRKKRRRKR